MTYRQLFIAVQGLRERDQAQESIYRRMTLLICASGFNGKAVVKGFKKSWPMDTDPTGEQIASRAKEIIRRHREAEALTKANDKLNARRTKNRRTG